MPALARFDRLNAALQALVLDLRRQSVEPGSSQMTNQDFRLPSLDRVALKNNMFLGFSVNCPWLYLHGLIVRSTVQDSVMPSLAG